VTVLGQSIDEALTRARSAAAAVGWEAE